MKVSMHIYGLQQNHSIISHHIVLSKFSDQ